MYSRNETSPNWNGTPPQIFKKILFFILSETVCGSKCFLPISEKVVEKEEARSHVVTACLLYCVPNEKEIKC